MIVSCFHQDGMRAGKDSITRMSLDEDFIHKRTSSTRTLLFVEHIPAGAAFFTVELGCSNLVTDKAPIPQQDNVNLKDQGEAGWKRLVVLSDRPGIE
jgi:hypothetical protein